jgi:hypothetical protein
MAKQLIRINGQRSFQRTTDYMPSSNSTFQETTTTLEESFSCTVCLRKKQMFCSLFCNFMQNKHAERRTHTIWLYAEIPMVWETGKSVQTYIYRPTFKPYSYSQAIQLSQGGFRNERIAKNKSVFRMWYVFS